MNDNLKVLLLNVSCFDRSLAENLENEEITVSDLQERLESEREKDDDDNQEQEDNFLWLSLSEFADYCNDQEFNPDSWWVSYVYLTDEDECNDRSACEQSTTRIVQIYNGDGEEVGLLKTDAPSSFDLQLLFKGASAYDEQETLFDDEWEYFLHLLNEMGYEAERVFLDE